MAAAAQCPAFDEKRQPYQAHRIAAEMELAWRAAVWVEGVVSWVVGRRAKFVTIRPMPYTNADLLESLREKIPTFRCIVGCHDCCGPVTASSEEVARLPIKTDAEHERALTDLTCPYLGTGGCEVYAERPLICRLFGTSPRLPCPNGMRPVYMVDDATEQAVHRFLSSTRQVLL